MTSKRHGSTEEDWEALESLCKDFLTKCINSKFQSFKGYFFYGISLYRLNAFEDAVKAFKEAEAIHEEDSQLHYNLGLAYFKLELYNPAVEHWRRCIRIDPKSHPFAFSNLAFLLNLHQFY